MSKTFQTHYRVYFEDTDAGGIMYHGNFINFCERARSDLLREIGFPSSQVMEKLHIGFVVRHLEAEYLRMVRLDDLLTVETTMKTIKNSSFVMRQVIFCQNITVFSMDVTLVCIDKNGKPVRTPEILRTELDKYLLEEDV